ncbi:MAG: hypothetical protein JW982_01305 [Spirochaetes bacterium]|nr:hypothetical protein [Spirochaetota bacterium]
MTNKIKFLITIIIISLLASCGQKNTDRQIISGSLPVDLINPNGIYEYLIFEASSKALSGFDIAKYNNKHILLTYSMIAGEYTEEIITSSIENLLSANNVSVSKDNAQEKIQYDYKLNFSVPVCGIHEYSGLVRTNISANIIINLTEISAEGNQKFHTSGLIVKKYDHLLLNEYSITSFWIIMLSLLFLAALRILLHYYRK